MVSGGWRRGRAIEQLRAVWGGQWRWVAETREYIHESGRRVYRCAALAPRFDGDDDNFETQLRWADTGERAEYRGRDE